MMIKIRYCGWYGLIASLWLIFAACPLVSNQEKTLEIAFPLLPAAWQETLGNAAWCVQWMNREGKRESLSFPVGTATATIPWDFSWGTPLWAYPYWPDRSIPAGMVHPAGAIFPLELELSSGRIVLSWPGGVAATLYEALLRYGMGVSYRPECFNWPRFCELLSEYLSGGVIGDPWNVDWEAVAQKTVRSGFTSRYLKEAPSERRALSLPPDVPPARWVSDSPFGLSLFLVPGASSEISCYPWVDRLLSPYGILNYSQQGLVYCSLPVF
ncbi:hypothetical protein [Treponema sp. J25]|uniref:hypothetical protein n=1 Tax=Treponema sp. J25 TaxID=2094121 RepID=UPI00104D4111|nr:hypothetical protein [Treponema sp. J25]